MRERAGREFEKEQEGQGMDECQGPQKGLLKRSQRKC